MFENVMDQIRGSENINDGVRYEFICYQRLKLQVEKYNLTLLNVEAEHKRKLDYFIKLSRVFGLVLQDISGMKSIRRTNHVSIGYLLNIVEKSLQLDDSSTLAIENIWKNTISVILDDIVNKFSTFDFNAIFMIIGVRKIVFQGTITQDYGDVLVKVVTKRLLASREEYRHVFQSFTKF